MKKEVYSTPLETMLSLPYEAHFRAELSAGISLSLHGLFPYCVVQYYIYICPSCHTAFSTWLSNTVDDFAKRAATFESVYAVTKKDRVSNGTAAEERRVKNMEANSAHDDLTDEDHALTTGGISIDFDEEDIY